MKVIIHPAITEHTMSPSSFAQAVADHGLHGVYLPEHTHIPVAYEPADYPQEGVELPDRYRRLFDPYVALAFIAAQARLEIGTCVSLVGQHDPIALAKTIATLDVLSGGNFVLGLGFGWNTREFANHGRGKAKDRAQVVAENVAIMRRLWTEDVASFSGTFVKVEPSWAWPKPTQKPHPLVMLGASGTEANFRRIAEWADGWITMTGHLQHSMFPGQVASLRRIWEDHGRDPATLRLMVLELPGDRDAMARSLDIAQHLGLDRLVMHTEDLPWSEQLRIMDDLAPLMQSAGVAAS